MDSSLADRKRGFLDRFRAGRVRMACPRKIFGGTAEFHQHRGLMDHFAGFRADDVNTQHAVGLRIGKDFHETIGGLIDLGARVRGERKLACFNSSSVLPTEATSGNV